MEDRRRGGPGGVVIGGGLGTLVVIVLALLSGADPVALLQQFQGDPQLAPQAGQAVDPGNDELKDFVSVVLADTEDVWQDQFRRLGKTYRNPHLVLFSGQVQSACGFADAAVGPFYCPADERIYIDLSFYEDLKSRYQAPGDFAQAYVIAHEIGHHVQNLLGISDKVHAKQGRVSKAEANRLSVELELQADFLAGVWANHAQRMRHILEPGDLQEALEAASAIGDDRLQRQTRGYVVPDSFTHGTSAQRARWFRRGWDSGDLRDGDTFKTNDL